MFLVTVHSRTTADQPKSGKDAGGQSFELARRLPCSQTGLSRLKPRFAGYPATARVRRGLQGRWWRGLAANLELRRGKPVGGCRGVGAWGSCEPSAPTGQARRGLQGLASSSACSPLRNAVVNGYCSSPSDSNSNRRKSHLRCRRRRNRPSLAGRLLLPAATVSPDDCSQPIRSRHTCSNLTIRHSQWLT